MNSNLLGRYGVIALVTFVSSPAFADFPAPAPPRPVLKDDVNVDLISRSTSFKVTDVSIGSGDNALVHTFFVSGSRAFPFSFTDNFVGGLGDAFSGSCIGVGTAAASACFQYQNGTYVPLKAEGETLTSAGGNFVQYVNRIGDKYTIDTSKYGNFGNSMTTGGLLVKYERHDGYVLNYFWESTSSFPYFFRLLTIESSSGYSIKYEYSSDNYSDPGLQNSDRPWQRVSSVTAYNRAIEYCSPVADHCNFSRAWPKSNYSWQFFGNDVGAILTISDQNGATTKFKLDPVYRVIGYKPFSATDYQNTYVYCRAQNTASPEYYPSYGDVCQTYINGSVVTVYDGVKWAIKEGRQWTYQPSLSLGGCGCYYYNRSIDPLGRAISLTAFTNSAEPEVIISDSKDGVHYTWAQDANNRVQTATPSDEAGFSFAYDARGNVTSKRRMAPAGSALSDQVSSASYPAVCDSPSYCNKPTSVIDPNGNSAQFTYDTTHGGVLTETGPADASGVRPVKRYAYAQRYAWWSDGAGGYVRAATPIWVKTEERSCRTSATSGNACVGGASDEVVTSYDYGPDAGPNNLLVRGVSVVADGVTQRTCFGYDALGHKVSETKGLGAGVCP